ncbi:MAG: WYL domain-containing protein, partial [Thermoguttaceae bacterium]
DPTRANPGEWAPGEVPVPIFSQPLSEQPPLVRQWMLLRALAARKYGATVKELAEEAEVSVPTIRRDLRAFQTAGFPIRETVAEYGRKKWHLDRAEVPAELTFTWEEAAALHLGRRFLEPLAGTVFWQGVQTAFKKIRAVLGPAPLNYLDKFAAIFGQTMVGTHDYSKKAELIDDLMRAVEDSHEVALTYQALQSTEPVTYTIHPYGLAYHRGALYVVGRPRRHQDICHWKVDRIEAAEIGDQRFARPAGFDLQEHISKSFGVFPGDGSITVKVRFSPAVARFVEEAVWHPSQRLTRRRDGSVIAEFDLAGTEEVQRWIMGFGRHAEVLEPPELREAIIEERKEAIAIQKKSFANRKVAR